MSVVEARPETADTLDQPPTLEQVAEWGLGKTAELYVKGLRPLETTHLDEPAELLDAGYPQRYEPDPRRYLRGVRS